MAARYDYHYVGSRSTSGHPVSAAAAILAIHLLSDQIQSAVMRSLDGLPDNADFVVVDVGARASHVERMERALTQHAACLLAALHKLPTQRGATVRVHALRPTPAMTHDPNDAARVQSFYGRELSVCSCTQQRLFSEVEPCEHWKREANTVFVCAYTVHSLYHMTSEECGETWARTHEHSLLHNSYHVYHPFGLADSGTVGGAQVEFDWVAEECAEGRMITMTPAGQGGGRAYSHPALPFEKGIWKLSPRGASGNQLQTVLAMDHFKPQAFGDSTPTVIGSLTSTDMVVRENPSLVARGARILNSAAYQVDGAEIMVSEVVSKGVSRFTFADIERDVSASVDATFVRSRVLRSTRLTGPRPTVSAFVNSISSAMAERESRWEGTMSQLSAAVALSQRLLVEWDSVVRNTQELDAAVRSMPSGGRSVNTRAIEEALGAQKELGATMQIVTVMVLGALALWCTTSSFPLKLLWGLVFIASTTYGFTVWTEALHKSVNGDFIDSMVRGKRQGVAFLVFAVVILVIVAQASALDVAAFDSVLDNARTLYPEADGVFRAIKLHMFSCQLLEEVEQKQCIDQGLAFYQAHVRSIIQPNGHGAVQSGAELLSAVRAQAVDAVGAIRTFAQRVADEVPSYAESLRMTAENMAEQLPTLEAARQKVVDAAVGVRDTVASAAADFDGKVALEHLVEAGRNAYTHASARIHRALGQAEPCPPQATSTKLYEWLWPAKVECPQHTWTDLLGQLITSSALVVLLVVGMLLVVPAVPRVLAGQRGVYNRVAIGGVVFFLGVALALFQAPAAQASDGTQVAWGLQSIVLPLMFAAFCVWSGRRVWTRGTAAWRRVAWAVLAVAGVACLSAGQVSGDMSPQTETIEAPWAWLSLSAPLFMLVNHRLSSYRVIYARRVCVGNYHERLQSYRGPDGRPRPREGSPLVVEEVSVGGLASHSRLCGAMTLIGPFRFNNRDVLPIVFSSCACNALCALQERLGIVRDGVDAKGESAARSSAFATWGPKRFVSDPVVGAWLREYELPAVKVSEWLERFPESKREAITREVESYYGEGSSANWLSMYASEVPLPTLKGFYSVDLFVKIEKALKVLKVDADAAKLKPRVISNPTPLSKAFFGPRMYAVSKWMRARFAAIHRAVYAGGLDAAAVGDWFRLLIEDSDLYVWADMSAYEGSISVDAHSVERLIMATIGVDSECLDFMLNDVAVTGRFGRWFKYVTRGIRKSGRDNTSTGNSGINWSSMSAAIVELIMTLGTLLDIDVEEAYSIVVGELLQDIHMIYMGDDNALGLPTSWVVRIGRLYMLALKVDPDPQRRALVSHVSDDVWAELSLSRAGWWEYDLRMLRHYDVLASFCRRAMRVEYPQILATYGFTAVVQTSFEPRAMEFCGCHFVRVEAWIDGDWSLVWAPMPILGRQLPKILWTTNQMVVDAAGHGDLGPYLAWLAEVCSQVHFQCHHVPVLSVLVDRVCAVFGIEPTASGAATDPLDLAHRVWRIDGARSCEATYEDAAVFYGCAVSDLHELEEYLCECDLLQGLQHHTLDLLIGRYLEAELE